MAAVSACMELFSPLRHILCSEDLYGGVIRLFDKISTKNGLSIRLADTASTEAIEAAVRPETVALYIETPSNPMMNVTDLRACRTIADPARATPHRGQHVPLPYLQNPIELGADLVIHSGSKFIAGHNDTISGFVCSATDELAERVRLVRKRRVLPSALRFVARAARHQDPRCSHGTPRSQRTEDRALASRRGPHQPGVLRWLEDTPAMTAPRRLAAPVR